MKNQTFSLAGKKFKNKNLKIAETLFQKTVLGTYGGLIKTCCSS